MVGVPGGVYIGYHGGYSLPGVYSPVYTLYSLPGVYGPVYLPSMPPYYPWGYTPLLVCTPRIPLGIHHGPAVLPVLSATWTRVSWCGERKPWAQGRRNPWV